MSETIGRQTASYRQGLVLGLTMAEIMLLLVFCMLIAVGGLLANEETKLHAAMARLRKVEVAAAADRAIVEPIEKNTRLAELLQRASRSASQRDIDEFWRKLVESNDVVESLERHGVSRLALKEGTDSFTRLPQLLSRHIDPEKATRGIALAAAIDEAVAAKAMSALTPEQAAVLIQRGIEASKPAGESEGGHTWPPIITLSEAGGYYFATGSAELTPDFAFALRTAVVSRLLEIAAAFDVDVIEVIGHTDEQPISNRVSNLDRSLAAVTSGAGDAGTLLWADNAGLGLARALAVVKVLASDTRLRSFRILPLSGAQLIDTDGRLTHWDGQSDVRERRRIEIRMRKSG